MVELLAVQTAWVDINTGRYSVTLVAILIALIFVMNKIVSVLKKRKTKSE
jgi:hypothetical protein